MPRKSWEEEAIPARGKSQKFNQWITSKTLSIREWKSNLANFPDEGKKDRIVKVEREGTLINLKWRCTGWEISESGFRILFVWKGFRAGSQ